MPDFIGSNWFDSTIWKCVNGAWSELTPALPGGVSEARTVWGAYDGNVWRHNGDSTTAKFLLLSGSTWSEYSEPPQAATRGPNDYCQSADGTHLYACKYDASHIKKLNGPVWDNISALSDMRSMWCDGTGQHVYAGPVAYLQKFFYSSDYGATWANIYSQLGITDRIGGVWGFGTGSNHVLFVCTREASSTGGRLFRGKAGGPWVEVARSANYWIGTWLWGPDEDNIIVMGHNAANSVVILKRNGSSFDVKHVCSGAKPVFSVGRVLIGYEQEILVAMESLTSTDGLSYRSTDGGDTWASLDMSAMGVNKRISGISLYGEYQPFPQAPVLRNQDPAPDSTGNAPDTGVYLEVYDENGDLTLSSVDIYLDGTLAWTGGAPTGQHSGRTRPVADAQGYWLYSWSYWSDGAHTVRVVAQDDLGNPLDETYSFSTTGAFSAVGVRWGEIFECLPEIVAPDPISNAGGEQLTISGIWPTDATVQVHLGPLGTTDDPLCYGGQGLGYEALSLDGETLLVASPPLPEGETFFTVVVDGEPRGGAGPTVIERSWPDKVHRMRRSFPAWQALGPRQIDGEMEQ